MWKLSTPPKKLCPHPKLPAPRIESLKHLTRRCWGQNAFCSRILTISRNWKRRPPPSSSLTCWLRSGQGCSRLISLVSAILVIAAGLGCAASRSHFWRCGHLGHYCATTANSTGSRQQLSAARSSSPHHPPPPLPLLSTTSRPFLTWLGLPCLRAQLIKTSAPQPRHSCLQD